MLVPELMSDRVPLTVQGKKALDEELRNLTLFERPKVIEAIAAARSNGDLSENADYDAAKERQGFIEGRIQMINAIMARVEVIDPSSIKSDKIVFGATVELEDTDAGKTQTYQIVGAEEADIKKGKLGITSPMARAMIGKKEGDEVVVDAPKGRITYEVLKIRYE
jgi:transcription elongation factor GreA